MIRKLLVALSGTDEAKKQIDKKNISNNSRTFTINKNVSTEAMSEMIHQITDIIEDDDREAEKKSGFVRKPIKITVESYGGNMYDGFHLTNIMDTSMTPFHTYSYGKCMSMALVIFASGHVRFAPAKATFMYHDASNSIGGTIEQMKRTLVQSRNLTDMMDDVIVSTSNITKEQLDEAKERVLDWYISGHEAHVLGLVDELIPSTRDYHRQK